MEMTPKEKIMYKALMAIINQEESSKNHSTYSMIQAEWALEKIKAFDDPKLFKFGTLDNPYLTDGYIEELKKDMNPIYFENQLLGKWEGE